MSRESGDQALGDGGEPAATWPEAFSPYLSPSVTAPISRPQDTPQDTPQERTRPPREDLSRGLPPENAAGPRPIRRAALRGHVARRHLGPVGPE